MVPESFSAYGFPLRRVAFDCFPALPARSVLVPERFRGGCSFGVTVLAARGLSRPSFGTNHRIGFEGYRVRMASFDDNVRALTEPIGSLGGAWMLHPEVLGPCRDVGYPNGFAYYVTGRGGVLGDVDADVVSSAFGFFEPSLVRKLWEQGTAVESARSAARRYGAACAQWGSGRYGSFIGVERLAELAEVVVRGVDVSGLALFAGWRNEPLPSDAGGRATLLLHMLRELRGSVHLLCVVATGLTTRDAVLASGGAEQATKFGWSGPFPDIVPSTKKEAEDLTDRVLIGLYRHAASEEQVDELTKLVLGLQSHVTRG